MVSSVQNNPLAVLSQLSLEQLQGARESAPPEELSDEELALQQIQEVIEGASEEGSPFDSELTEEEQKIVDELKQTDQEVRAHEQAHKNVAGPYAGAISYETVTGPDGREYAVAGEVQIDVSPNSW